VTSNVATIPPAMVNTAALMPPAVAIRPVAEADGNQPRHQPGVGAVGRQGPPEDGRAGGADGQRAKQGRRSPIRVTITSSVTGKASIEPSGAAMNPSRLIPT
jgi:hypothetical protein